MIPFNQAYLVGKEVHYIYDAVASGHISGNGKYTRKCQAFFEQRYGFKKTLLTTSGTDALEMCALLLDIRPGDEVIMPSYTFVSTALAFVRQGAKIVFIDSRQDHPDMDENAIRDLITPKTKVIVCVHYAGVACNMEQIMAIAKKHDIYVVEDAAHAIDSFYKGKPLGSFGHLAAFSFHETKNIQCGEGGLLAVNDVRFCTRSEIIWEKGTNRAEFFRGEADKYGWVDIGSSFLPSEITAAFLWAQLESMEEIQKKRRSIWEAYASKLHPLNDISRNILPKIPQDASNNGHLFYLVCRDNNEQQALISFLKSAGIEAVFHYLSLHKSSYYSGLHDGRPLPYADRYSDCLVRLPFYYELTNEQIDFVCEEILNYFNAI